MGLPLPAPFLQALAYLTLTLHFLAMQYTVGGAILALWTWRKDRSVARFFGTGLPLGFSYLVTLGIPPLLFVQVMYGQFFYSSSVLIGAFWISVVPLIIIGYGAAYWHRMSRDSRPKFQLVLLVATTLALLSVGFIYVNNLTLSMSPGRWMALYQAHPAGGTLNLSEPTILPRYAFFIVPALFVAGLALVLRAAYLRNRNPEAATASQRMGLRAMLLAALLQAGAAVAFWQTLPQSITQVLAHSGLHLGLAIAASLLGIAALATAWLSSKRAGMGLPVLAAHLYVGAQACVVVLRDLVRQLYLAPYFKLSDAPVYPQWGMFIGFVVALLAGLVFLVVLTKQMVSGLVAADVPGAKAAE